MNQNVKKALTRIIQIIIIGAIFFFLFRSLYKNWALVKTYTWHFNYVFIAASSLALMAIFFFLAFLWHWMLNRLGGRLSLRKSLRIWFISNLGRYLPGKIWQVVGMVYMVNKEGVPTEHAITSAILSQTLAIIPGLLLSILTYAFLTFARNQWFYLLLIPPAAVLMFLIAYPPFLERVINVINRRLKRPLVHFTMGFKDSILFMGLYLVAWLLLGGAFFLFTRSLTGPPWGNLIAYPGIFTGSYLAGLLSIFVPGGLGVREGILTYLLAFYFPLPIATAISLGSRIWMTAVEGICVLITLKL